LTEKIFIELTTIVVSFAFDITNRFVNGFTRLSQTGLFDFAIRYADRGFEKVATGLVGFTDLGANAADARIRRMTTLFAII
jgi:hypothetical protein